jgi:uncharacterized protein YjbI with pentapeptide repeats
VVSRLDLYTNRGPLESSERYLRNSADESTSTKASRASTALRETSPPLPPLSGDTYLQHSQCRLIRTEMPKISASPELKSELLTAGFELGPVSNLGLKKSTFVIGDMEGELSSLLVFFKMAGLSDYVKLVFDETHNIPYFCLDEAGLRAGLESGKFVKNEKDLFLMGDFSDRGAMGIILIKTLEKMMENTTLLADIGLNVHILFGNHDVYHLTRNEDQDPQEILVPTIIPMVNGSEFKADYEAAANLTEIMKNLSKYAKLYILSDDGNVQFSHTIITINFIEKLKQFVRQNQEFCELFRTEDENSDQILKDLDGEDLSSLRFKKAFEKVVNFLINERCLENPNLRKAVHTLLYARDVESLIFQKAFPVLKLDKVKTDSLRLGLVSSTSCPVKSGDIPPGISVIGHDNAGGIRNPFGISSVESRSSTIVIKTDGATSGGIIQNRGKAYPKVLQFDPGEAKVVSLETKRSPASKLNLFGPKTDKGFKKDQIIEIVKTKLKKRDVVTDYSDRTPSYPEQSILMLAYHLNGRDPLEIANMYRSLWSRDKVELQKINISNAKFNYCNLKDGKVTQIKVDGQAYPINTVYFLLMQTLWEQVKSAKEKDKTESSSTRCSIS